MPSLLLFREMNPLFLSVFIMLSLFSISALIFISISALTGTMIMIGWGSTLELNGFRLWLGVRYWMEKFFDDNERQEAQNIVYRHFDDSHMNIVDLIVKSIFNCFGDEYLSNSFRLIILLCYPGNKPNFLWARTRKIVVIACRTSFIHEIWPFCD